MQESSGTYRVVTEVLLLELKGCHYVVCVRWLDAQDLRLLASFAKVQLKVSKKNYKALIYDTSRGSLPD